MTKGKVHKYDVDLLKRLVLESTSYSEVLRKMGFLVIGGSKLTHLKKVINALQMDTSHFSFYSRRTRSNPISSMSLDEIKNEILCVRPEGSHRMSSSKLRKCLELQGFSYTCNVCKMLPLWNGKPLVLDINHINGNPLDNTIENLEFICPNCHRQTETFGSKNKRSTYCELVSYTFKCKSCYNDFSTTRKNAKFCSRDCAGISLRRVERPSKELLEELLQTRSVLAVSKIFKVSDNAVRKWIKKYGMIHETKDRVVNDGRSVA